MPEDLKLRGSQLFPLVDFRRNGNLRMCGKLIPDHVYVFFRPLHQWISELDVPRVQIEFNFEYLRTNALNEIKELLRGITGNSAVKQVFVKWYYESDDEESHEMGLILEELFESVQFRFIEIEESTLELSSLS
jgi:hypothetical protein